MKKSLKDFRSFEPLRFTALFLLLFFFGDGALAGPGMAARSVPADDVRPQAGVIEVTTGGVGERTSQVEAPAGSDQNETDISISGLEVPVSVTRGERVPVTVTVRNQGANDVGDDMVITLSNPTDGRVIGTRNLEGGLERNKSRSFTYNWDTAGSSTGIHLLEAHHDYADTDSTNNRLTATVAVNQPLENDLAITSLDAPLEVLQGEEVTAIVTVENLSWRDVTEPFDIVLLDGESEIARQSHQEGLNAGEQITLIYHWDTGQASPGMRPLTARLLHSDENEDNNTRTSSLTVEEPKPYDLSITDLIIQDGIVRGETVQVLVNLRNVGLEAIEDEFDVSLTDYTNSREIGRHTYTDGLASGDSANFSFTWNTSEVSPGNLVLVASHSFDDDNAGNNVHTTAVDIDEAALTDIAVTGISVDSHVIRGEVIIISVAVQNLGNQNVQEDIRVTLYNETDQVEIGSELIRGGLARDNSITMSFTWDTRDTTTRSHRLIASHDLKDGNDSNNSLSYTIRITESGPNLPTNQRE